VALNDNPTTRPREAPRWLRTTLLVGGALAAVVLLYLVLRPQPVSVDLADVTRGPVEVVVEEDGRTRVRDRYLVTAPVAGTLRRVELEAGDTVAPGTPLAHLDAPASQPDDPRTSSRTRARLDAARATVERARALAEAAEAAIVEAREQVRRHEVLLEQGGTSPSALERARALLAAREAEARSARFAVEVARGEVADLEAALALPADGAAAAALVLRAPVAGVVLRVHREDAGSVTPGEPLVELGDPSALEVVVDLLSADAVRVEAGHEARIVRWGGEGDLTARVRRVEPSGFTQVSALGIEEQRVNVLLTPGPEEAWARLGDGFRVEAGIVVDRIDDALRIPAGALVRQGDGWAVFRVRGRRLDAVPVQVGRRSQTVVEIVSGLVEGDRVVVYPGDRVEDGVRYRIRD
jgi:HlyD family secretion protein